MNPRLTLRMRHLPEHGIEGVRGGQEGDSVRVKFASLDHEGDVREGGAVDILR